MSQILSARKRSERGFVLILIGACAVVMVGMLGLTTDLGRVYVAKNELQTFVDAASVAAALELDGTDPGIVAANSAGVTGPVGQSGTVNSWYFSTQTVPNPTVTFSTTLDGVYNPMKLANVDSRFVKVALAANLPMFFMPIVPGVARSVTVNAVATAGQRALNNAKPGDVTVQLFK